MALLIYVIIALATGILYRFLLKPAFFSPLAAIPLAHWSARFSNAWILRARYGRRENHTIHEAHQRLGPIVRLGPSEIAVNDLQSLKTVYLGGWEKPEWYLLFTNYWGYGYLPNPFRSATSFPKLKLIDTAFPTCSPCCAPLTTPVASGSSATSTQSHISNGHLLCRASSKKSSSVDFLA
jgi:hypothetical protein